MTARNRNCKIRLKRTGRFLSKLITGHIVKIKLKDEDSKIL